MCIVCFFLGYFVADVVSKCGFGREHYAAQDVFLAGAEDDNNYGHVKAEAGSGGDGLMQASLIQNPLFKHKY